MLESMSFVTTQASSGDEAVANIVEADRNGTPIEVVYMDWQMPGLKGVATSKKIKEQELSLQPKIIMITGYENDEVTEQAEELVLEEFLIKPVNRSMLFDATMQALGVARGRDASRKTDKDYIIEELKGIRGARILLAEDNELNQQVAREILEQAGFVVEIANNGGEAVELVKEHDYDLILMDIQMPVVSGIEATQTIRNLEFENRYIPIVAMTAHAMVGDRKKSLETGMNDHITKPIDPDKLIAVLLQWIEPGTRLDPVGSSKQIKNGDNLSPLPGFAGIDVEAGLARVRGNQKLYRELLLKFKQKYSTIGDVLLTFGHEQSTLKEVQALAHTMKGVAGNIGAGTLAQLAAELEQVARDGDLDEAKKVVSFFTEELSRVLTALREVQDDVPEEEEQGAPIKQGTPAEHLLLLDALEPVLKEGVPMKCGNIMQEINKLSWPENLSEEIEQLSGLIREYNFLEAVNRVQAIRMQISDSEK